jgi:hypothetical protein
MLLPILKASEFSAGDPPHLREADLNEVAYGHGCWGRVILWSSGSPVQRGIPLAERHQPSCKSLIAKGTDSSSIAVSNRPTSFKSPLSKVPRPEFSSLVRGFPPAALPIGR